MNIELRSHLPFTYSQLTPNPPGESLRVLSSYKNSGRSQGSFIHPPDLHVQQIPLKWKCQPRATTVGGEHFTLPSI